MGCLKYTLAMILPLKFVIFNGYCLIFDINFYIILLRNQTKVLLIHIFPKGKWQLRAVMVKRWIGHELTWVWIVLVRVLLGLTHWGWVTHICVSRLTITGSDSGLSPGRRQAIILTNAGILLIGPLGTNFSENLIAILIFSFTKMWLTVSSAKWRPFGLGPDVLSRPDFALWGVVMKYNSPKKYAILKSHTFSFFRSIVHLSYRFWKFALHSKISKSFCH